MNKIIRARLLISIVTTLSTFSFTTQRINAQQSVQECVQSLVATGVSANQAAVACQNQTGDPLRNRNRNQGIDQSCVDKLMYRTIRSSGEANYTDYDKNYQQVTRSGYQFDYGGDLTAHAMELAGLQEHGNYFYGDSPVATVQVMEAEDAITKCRNLSR